MSEAKAGVVTRFTDFWWDDRGMSLVLLLLFVTLFLTAFVDSALWKFLASVLFSLLLLSGVTYVFARPLFRVLAGVVAAATIGLHWLRDLIPPPGGAIVSNSTAFVFLFLLTVVMLARVFAGDGGRVTVHRVRGAIAAYLLFAIAWAHLYAAIENIAPGAFIVSTSAEGKTTDYIYFSFVTLTTLGFGDITPVNPVLRMAVVVEALVGQLYPATLLARLVSLEISDRQVPAAGGAGEPSIASRDDPPAAGSARGR